MFLYHLCGKIFEISIAVRLWGFFLVLKDIGYRRLNRIFYINITQGFNLGIQSMFAIFLNRESLSSRLKPWPMFFKVFNFNSELIFSYIPYMV
ncbi:hypothetical protein D0817_22045 [Flavobacterium cupreum]|uniref:Uncharacterized protein n=1 Tax=Flavobacterium cupreum TaxID=2133766 RepID=A0A434A1I6_9FLAO|nr:hypothetical protein D0817_22045 [Flavobacterium cupreum]